MSKPRPERESVSSAAPKPSAARPSCSSIVDIPSPRKAFRGLGSEENPMPLRAYNTLTRQKEPFETVRPDKVGMYVCGPTVYKPSHLGHMVGPVIFDTIKRYLAYVGYQVTLVT